MNVLIQENTSKYSILFFRYQVLLALNHPSDTYFLTDEMYLNRKDGNRMKTTDICLNYVTMLPSAYNQKQQEKVSILFKYQYTYRTFMYDTFPQRYLLRNAFHSDTLTGILPAGHAMPNIFRKILIKFI